MISVSNYHRLESYPDYKNKKHIMIKRFFKLISFIIWVILILIRFINLISYIILYILVYIIDIILIPIYTIIWLIIGKNLFFKTSFLITCFLDDSFNKLDDYLLETQDSIEYFINYK